MAAQSVILSGQVLDEEGRPMSGATVALFPMLDFRERGPREPSGSLEPDPVANVTSDEAGWIEIEAPGIGFWRLRVESEGRSPMETTIQPLLQSTTLEAVTLPRTEPVEVQVVNSRGLPVAGAQVRSWTVPPVWGSSERPAHISNWRPESRFVRTDTEGFATVLLATGDFAWAEKEGYLAAFATRSLDEDGFLDQHILLELQRRPEAGATTAGRVTARSPTGLPTGSAIPFGVEVFDMQGQPISDALIWGWYSRRSARTGPDGRYVGTFEGRFPPRLYVAKQGFASRTVTWRRLDGRLEVTARVTLEPAGVIRGRVLNQAGDPIAGLEIELDPRGPWGRGLGPTSVLSGRAGNFRFDALPPDGAYVLELSHPGAPPVRRPVEIGADVEVRIEAGATLVGRLVDEKGSGIAAGRVELFHDPDCGELPIRRTDDGHSVVPASSDQQGRFSLDGVPRGRHGALITAPGRAPRALMDVEFDEGEIRDLGELTLRDSTLLRLRFVDSDQRPVAGVEVRINRSSHPPFRDSSGRDLVYLLKRQLPSEFETDGQGRVVIDGFTAGSRVRLSFSHPEFQDGTRDFAVVEGESEVVLERGRLLESRVLLNGAPADDRSRSRR